MADTGPLLDELAVAGGLLYGGREALAIIEPLVLIGVARPRPEGAKKTGGPADGKGVRTSGRQEWRRRRAYLGGVCPVDGRPAPASKTDKKDCSKNVVKKDVNEGD